MRRLRRNKASTYRGGGTSLRPERWLLGFVAGAALLFLILPVAALIGLAISVQAWNEMPQKAIVQAVLLSFVTTSITSLLTLAFGTPLAYVFARGRFPLRRVLNLFLELPVVMPPAVAGLALLVTFGRNGVLGSLMTSFGISLPFTTAAVIVAETFVSAPFYIRSAQAGFANVPHDIEDAARVDGASPFTLFRYVTLPLASRSLGAGLVLSWARALGEFGASLLFAGSLQGRTQTLPLLIYTILESNINAAIGAGVLLILLAFLALLFSQWLRREEPLAD